MMIGPSVLLLLAIGIANRGQGWLTPVDIAFLVVLAAMVAARWLEFRRGAALKGTGEPATRTDLLRYVPIAVATGLAVWIVANLVGNYWLA
jgi:hypothetical protein